MTNGIFQTMDNIPSEMTEVPMWLIFKLEDRGDGKFSKPPRSPYSGYKCDKTDSSHYVKFERALVGVEMYDADGVGFIFDKGFVAIDLDDCFDEKTGLLNDKATRIFERFKATYIEYSPSGKGLHIFCQGEKPNNRTRVDGIEVYSGKNFVTVTGDRVEGTGEKALHMQDALDWLFDEYLPEENLPSLEEIRPVLVDHGNKTTTEWLELGLRNDSEFRDLYNDTNHEGDESSADMRLMCRLAYHLNKDVNAMETEFMNSPYCRSKDDRHMEKIKRDDYFSRTVQRALNFMKATARENELLDENMASVSLRISEGESGEIIIPLEEYTDIANARLFAKTNSEALAYTGELGWCAWDGMKWNLGRSDRAMSCAVTFAENLMYMANEVRDNYVQIVDERGLAYGSKEAKEILAPAVAFYKHAQYTSSTKGLKAMLEIAEHMLRVPVEEFDYRPWELNTLGVVVNMKTGVCFPPVWNQYNSMSTTIPYNPNPENHGRWDSFLQKICCGDQELIDYLQLQLGAAIVGHVYEENLVLFNGEGSNGKSTLFNIVKEIMGSYAVSVNPDVLMNLSHSNTQQEAAATLKGKRIAFAQETKRKQTFDSASIKRMSSTDTIVGRVLYRGLIEFKPSHSVFLATNHLPRVEDGDYGTWRRIIVIPFNARITEDEVITNFQDLLIEEDGEYILKWLVDGAIKFFNNGKVFGDKPQAVRDAVAQYKDGERELIDDYIEARIYKVDESVNDGYFLYPKDVYEDYFEWAKSVGVAKPLNQNLFGRAFKTRGLNKESVYVKERGNSFKVYRNIQFKEEDGTNPLIIEKG